MSFMNEAISEGPRSSDMGGGGFGNARDLKVDKAIYFYEKLQWAGSWAEFYQSFSRQKICMTQL